MTWVCPNCGYENDDDEVMCENCGEQDDTVDTSDPEYELREVEAK